MKIIITEDQYGQLTNLVKQVISENDSMTEKNKRFLKNKFGIDFTNGIQQVTQHTMFQWNLMKVLVPQLSGCG